MTSGPSNPNSMHYTTANFLTPDDLKEITQVGDFAVTSSTKKVRSKTTQGL